MNKVKAYKVKGLAKLETNLDGGRSFSRILFAFHHGWKWVGFEFSLNWDANEIKKARDNRFLCLRDHQSLLLPSTFHFLQLQLRPNSNRTGQNNVCACASCHGARDCARPKYHNNPYENGGVFKDSRVEPGVLQKRSV